MRSVCRLHQAGKGETSRLDAHGSAPPGEQSCQLRQLHTPSPSTLHAPCDSLCVPEHKPHAPETLTSELPTLSRLAASTDNTCHAQVYHNREATCKIAWAWLQRCGSTVPTPAEEPPSPHRHPGHPRRNRTNILIGHHSGAARFYRRHQQEQPSTHHPFHAADLDVSHPLDPETLPSSSAAGPSDPLSTCLLHMSLEAGPGPSAPPVGPSAPPMGPSPPMGSVGPQVGVVSLPGGSSGLPGALPMILDTDSFPSASPKYPTGWQWPLSTPRRAGRSAASAGSPERPHRLERSARPERHDRAKRARRIQPPDACQRCQPCCS